MMKSIRGQKISSRVSYLHWLPTVDEMFIILLYVGKSGDEQFVEINR